MTLTTGSSKQGFRKLSWGRVYKGLACEECADMKII